MLQEKLEAKIRNAGGKGVAGSLRRSGFTPAVLYGPKTEPVLLSLETRPFTKSLLRMHGHNAVITLNISNDQTTGERHVMIKEIQTDPVQDFVLHADFYEISLENKVCLPVPLRFVGKAKGVDLGGDLHPAITEIHVHGLPLDIPDFVEIDVTQLELGAGIRLGDITLSDKIELKDDKDTVCVSVIAHVGA